MHDMNGIRSTPKQQRKPRKLSILFPRTDAPVHCAGVNSVLLSPGHDLLFTASRDATIKRWRLGEADGVGVGVPVCEATYEEHADWVNDIALVGPGLLASGSSDRAVKLWRATGEGKCIATLMAHADFVTALAAAKHVPLLASAGLRGQVLLWDLSTVKSTSVNPAVFAPAEMAGQKASVYAVALSASGALVAAGSPEAAIRVSDARTGQKVMKLRGHSDAVRALVLSEGGDLALSGASDHTLRLWDLGQQRCVQTFAAHTDSVWALQASPDFATAYSGGRDGCVYRTHLPSRTAELMFHERHPVRRLALNTETSTMWAATTSSTVRQWRLPSTAAPPPSLASAWDTPRRDSSSECGGGTEGGGGGSSGGGRNDNEVGPVPHSFTVGASPLLRQRQVFDTGTAVPAPAAAAPELEARGMPPVTHLAVLADRRHVLTQDAAGDVELWDLTGAAPLQRFGQVDFAAKERALFRPASVPAWFAADCRLGALAVTLEAGSAFVAEIYAADLSPDDAPEDLKKNFGEQLLKAVLGRWAEGFMRAWVDSGGRPPPSGPDDRTASGLGAGPSGIFRVPGPVPPVVMGELDSDGAPWRKAADAFTGREKVNEVIPHWAAEAVINSAFPQSAETKCGFVLQPEEGSTLPSMLQCRLNAPRILRAAKVAAYAQSKLAEAGLDLELAPVYWDPAARARQRRIDAQMAQRAAAGQRLPARLELVCGGAAVPHDLSLAAVKKYVWRRSDDLLLQYRIADPARRAPLPLIQPP